MIAFLYLSAALILIGTLELILRWLDVADPPIFRYDENCGYLMHAEQSVSTRGHRFRINNVGFRGEDVGPRRPGECRIAFVGDSISYGGGSIREAELFSTRVSTTLGARYGRNVIVVNISAPGWGILNMSAFVTSQGTFDADVVVWVLPSTDFYRRKTALHALGYPVARPWGRLSHVARSWMFAVKSRRVRRASELEATLLERADALETNLSALDATLRALVAAAVPQIVAVLPDEGGYQGLTNDVCRFKAIADKNGATFVDLAQAFNAYGETTELYLDGVHLNARGHEAVAQELVEIVHAVFMSRGI